MTLLNPIWLFLLFPLVVAMWIWKLPSRLLLCIRLLGLGLVILALCGLAFQLPSRAGIVVVIVDRSESMPENSRALQMESIRLLQKAMGSQDRLAIVTFGRTTAVEQPPGEAKFSEFVQEVGSDASNLAEAIQRGLSLIPKGSPGKILVFSDGRWTGSDPARITSMAAAQNIPIDFRPLSRSAANDLAIQQLDVPEIVNPGESFLITGWVYAPTARKARITFRRGDHVLVSEEQQLEAGLNPLRFRDQASEPGTMAYNLEVQSDESDPVAENNRARALVGARGIRPILHVSQNGSSALASLLRKGGMKIKEKTPKQCLWSLEDLSNYSAVLLENVSAELIGTDGMKTLVAWVRETGSGLMMTGGRDSYAPGGYYGSPLEPILPVSMELRQEHRKLSLAIVVALDRSGSMSASAGGGRTKMDLANLGTAEVLKLLSAIDEMGVIAVDSQPHIINDLGPVKGKAALRDKILSIKSMGGGIFVYDALEESARMLSKAKAGTRHIILFSDAADSEKPGDYKKLLAACQKAGITVSVIGLGTDTDQDAGLLRDIAKRGKGRCFFTSKPEELPRLFAQDTFVVARNTFLDEPTSIRSTGGLTTLTGKGFNFTESIGGYNLCYLRPEADLSVQTLDEYKAPVVASWHAGAGRVLCYTGEADGKYAGKIAQWAKVGDFYTSLARWTTGETQILPHNMVLTQEVRNGINVVKLHLDPQRKGEPFSGMPLVRTLRSSGEKAPTATRGPMRWLDADTLVMEVPLQGREVALTSVEIEEGKPVPLPPVVLPYSPEHKPGDGETGLPALQQISRATGGKERAEVSAIWKEIPRSPRTIDISTWLLIVAVVLLLLEVLERRTSLLSRAQRLIWAPGREKQARRKRVARREPKPSAASVSTSVPEESELGLVEEQVGGVTGAIRQARERTRDRYERRGSS